MKKGLILEGGAMRGLFTAGVMDVMMENGIQYDGVIGVSAGAAFGCNYKSGQIGRVLRYNTRFCADRRYSGFHSLVTSGNIYNTEFCYKVVPLEYDVFDFDAFENNSVEFYVVATDVESGKPVYHKYMNRADHGFDWIRASASMPLVSKIVEIEGLKMLDGGVSDSVPIRYFESIGYDRNVVILTQPEGYIKEKNPILPLMKMKYRKYPQFIQTLANRHIEYNDTLEYIKRKEKAGELLVIRPDSKLPVGKIEKDPKRLEEAYNIGRKIAEKRIEEIRKYLDFH